MLLATRGAEEIVSNTQRHVRLWLRARRQKKHAAGRIQELARKRSTVRRARRPADRLAACCKLQSLTRGQLARAQLRRDKARFAAARLREEKLKETTALIRLTNDEEKETWARLALGALVPRLLAQKCCHQPGLNDLMSFSDGFRVFS